MRVRVRGRGRCGPERDREGGAHTYAAGLPGAAPEAARHSVAAALADPALAGAAREAFTSAMSAAFTAAALALILMRDRKRAGPGTGAAGPVADGAH